jgi:hypothetical protein
MASPAIAGPGLTCAQVTSYITGSATSSANGLNISNRGDAPNLLLFRDKQDGCRRHP